MKALYFLLIWLVAGSVSNLVLTRLDGFQEAADLARNYVSASGEVLSVDTSNHLAAKIRVNVKGVNRELTVFGCVCAPGAVINVYFSPGNPDVASWDPPEAHYRANVVLMLWGSVILGGAMAVMATRWVPNVNQDWLPFDRSRRPKVAAILSLLGVLLGGAISLQLGMLGKWGWVSYSMACLGSVLIVERAWKLAPSVSMLSMFRSKSVLLGALLILAGVLLGRA
jgi:hypothetical protein